jgi:hypothetical protein
MSAPSNEGIIEVNEIPASTTPPSNEQETNEPSGEHETNENNDTTAMGRWWNELRRKMGGNVDATILKDAESGASYTPPSGVCSCEENPSPGVSSIEGNPPSRTSIVDGENYMVFPSPETPASLSMASDAVDLTGDRSVHLEASLSHEVFVRKLRPEKRGYIGDATLC